MGANRHRKVTASSQGLSPGWAPAGAASNVAAPQAATAAIIALVSITTTLTLPSFAWAQSLDETDDRRCDFSVHRVVEDVVVRAGELAEL